MEPICRRWPGVVAIHPLGALLIHPGRPQTLASHVPFIPRAPVCFSSSTLLCLWKPDATALNPAVVPRSCVELLYISCALDLELGATALAAPSSSSSLDRRCLLRLRPSSCCY